MPPFPWAQPTEPMTWAWKSNRLPNLPGHAAQTRSSARRSYWSTMATRSPRRTTTSPCMMDNLMLKAVFLRRTWAPGAATSKHLKVLAGEQCRGWLPSFSSWSGQRKLNHLWGGAREEPRRSLWSTIKPQRARNSYRARHQERSQMVNRAWSGFQPNTLLIE